MKKENLLLILPYWDSTFRNKNIGKLLQHLNQMDHQIHLYCSKSKGDEDIKDFIPGIILINKRPYTKKGILNRLNSIFIFLKILIKIKNVKIFWTYAGYIENLVISFLRIPFVLKSDSSLEIAKDKIKFIEKIRAFLFFEYVGKHATIVLIETKQLMEKASLIYNRKKVLYFPNGINIEKYNEFQSTFAKEIQKKNIFLCSGRMIYLKGIDLAIKSFALISKKLDWELHFVGSYEDEDYLKKCKELIDQYDLNDRVVFHDICFGHDLYKMYAKSSIFIMPSRNEGLANRLPEAMVFGNPIIAYNVGYTNELVNINTGALIEPEDYHSFSQAMYEHAVNHDLRSKISSHNRDLIIKNYDDKILFNSLFSKALECDFFQNHN